jgi:anti-anti-sigma regulatory factor
MGNVPHIDLAGVEFLIELEHKCRKSGIEFRLAEVHGEVREALRRSGEEHAGRLAEAHQTVAAVLSQWRGTSPGVA